MKSRVIFASLLLGLGVAMSQANAATTIIDDSPAANKPASTTLIKGSEKQFAQYVDQRAVGVTLQPEWQNFMRIVSLYNQTPVAVLNVPAAERQKFNQMAAQVNEVLSQQANVWQAQVSQTIRSVNFLWNVADAEIAE